MDSELFYVGIEPKGHHAKPAGKDMKYVKYNTVNNYGMCDLKTIVELVGNEGHAILPAYLKDGMKRENFQGMQIFMLDFDGQKISPNTGEKNGTNISYEEVKERAKQFGLDVAFAYKTFSCPDTEEFYKFRIAFIHNARIEDPNLAQFTYNMLKTIYKEADGACAELSRMFLGGKEVIDFNPNATHFDLVQLKNNIQPLLDNNRNFVRNQKNILHNTEIAFENVIVVDYLENISNYDANGEASNNIIIEEYPFASVFYKKCKVRNEVNDLHQKSLRDDKGKIKRHAIDVYKKKQVCHLMDAFLYDSIEEFSHDELFHLANNSNSIKGGKEMFFKTMEVNHSCETEDIKKWMDDWRRNIRFYRPSTCKNNSCRFYSECCKNNPCHSIVDKYLNDKGIYVDKIDLCEVEEEWEMLGKNLKSFMGSNEPGIHLIRGSTGLGKTLAIIQLLKEYPDCRFLLVEPLCALKKQVDERIPPDSDYEISCDEFINLLSVRDYGFFTTEEKEKYTELHEGGNHGAAKNIIVEKLKKTKKEHPENIREIEYYENVLYGLKEFQNKRIGITTHAKFIRMRREVLENCTKIIDEDIGGLQIFNNGHTISMESVIEVANSGVPGYSLLAKEMLNAKEGHYYKVDTTYYNLPEWSEFDIPMIAYSEEDDITDLREMGSYVLSNGVFIYYCAIKLDPRHKYLVLSATCDAKIYKDYFGKNMNIIEYPSCVAKYTGKLKQYTYYSMSRKCLSEHQEIYDYIKDKLGDIDIISFKSESKAKNCGKMYFGNAIGRDDLKGKNLAIIGTPFKAPIAYKLVCCYIYGENAVNGEDNPRPRRVKYMGREFLINTYENPDLQRYMLYTLYSDLEQTIGRARLLRFDCTVYLFSSFPCEQAEIDTSDYLSAYKQKKKDQYAGMDTDPF